MTYITFDTSFLENLGFDFDFIFFEKIDKSNHTLIISEIVDKEIRKHLKKWVSPFEDGIRAITPLKNEPKYKDIVGVDAKNDVINVYERFLKKHNAIIVPTSESKPDDVFIDYFNRGGAFKNAGKKNEFPDAFALSSIKNFVGDNDLNLIYGAAGTGKSTIVRFIFKLFGNVKKLCLAPTYPALENMARKIDDNTAEKYTLQRFVKDPSLYDCNYDVTVIDECSVVSNRLMNDFLNKIKTRVLILSGDIYQIPSIDFGNWFHLAKSFLPEKAKCELIEQFRTDDETLKELWKKVRSFDDTIGNFLESKRLVSTLNDNIFESKDEDEIILCLNYDGLFGVNNINLYLQTINNNRPYKWYQYTFKVGDPVLFSDTKRFGSIIYNNLKGKIKKIDLKEDRITFEIAIERALSSINFNNPEIEYVSNENNWTIVRFSVFKHNYSDYDRELNSRYLIPFHIAYAVSIHKAQGLEYNSVKIVLANNVEDNINHNIFYTAITRAKKQLMIYWTPETEKTILSNFKERFDKNDYSVLKSKWND